MKHTSLTVLLLLAACAATAEVKFVKVLSVGNSFSRNAHHYLPQITEAAGCRIVLKNAYIGGCDFERHMRHVDAFEANPNDKEGKPYEGKSLRELLEMEEWNYVTIQQASPKSFKFETFHPHVDRLIAYIKKYAPKAEIVIHQTWAYRSDHPFWGRTDFNDDIMYTQLKEAYGKLAQETGFRIIPCGDAFARAKASKDWGPFIPDPNFKRETAVKPNLPNEKRSLHAGYSWKENKLTFDGFHANTAGEYLQGCVWFEFFFKKSCMGNTFTPKGMNTEDALILQEIAHQTLHQK